MAALATEVRVVIENGFGTWKVKLKVNILLCFCVAPRQGRESCSENGGKCPNGESVDGDEDFESR